MPKKTIYIQTAPEKCMERTKKRSRPGEEQIILEDMNMLNNLYDDYFIDEGIVPRIVQHDKDLDDDQMQDLAEDLLGWCMRGETFSDDTMRRCYPFINEDDSVRSDENSISESTGSMFGRYFLNAPCQICGQMDHSMLRRDFEKDKIKYCCNFAVCDDWQSAKILQPRPLKYKICPRKLAVFYNHKLDKASEALELYRTNGSGKYINEKAYMDLRGEVTLICDGERRSLRLKTK